MSQLVLGIDPGRLTGVAFVKLTSTAPFEVYRWLEVNDYDLYRYLAGAVLHDVEALARQPLSGIVIEGYEIHHKRGLKGYGAAAEAFGYTRGVVRVRFPDLPIAIVTRRQVLKGLGLQATAGKAACRHAVARLATSGVDPDAFLRNSKGHVADAVATAIIGGGRLLDVELGAALEHYQKVVGA